MSSINPVLSSALTNSMRRKSNILLKVIFLWSPLVSLLFVLGFGGFDQFGLRYAISFIISGIVGSFCVLGSFFIDFVYDVFFRKRGLQARDRGVLRRLLNSYLFLVPGLYIGFAVAARFSAAIGSPWKGSPNLSDYSSGIIFGVLTSSLFLLFIVVKEGKEAKQAAALQLRELENEKLKAQISALSAQMNPHLLFNSLNTIASAIASDPQSAEDMIVKLSELYRGILKSAKGDMHSLESELQLCKSYLEIERQRFGPRVNYEITVDEAIELDKVKIPVLLLQPLVENAIKHGLAPKKDGGRVSIAITKTGSHFQMKVADDGVGIGTAIAKERSPNGTGTGLSNCESRIRLKYGSASKFDFYRHQERETIVSIQLPLSEVVGD